MEGQDRGLTSNLSFPLPSPAWQLHLRDSTCLGVSALKHPLRAEARPTAWPGPQGTLKHVGERSNTQLP